MAKTMEQYMSKTRANYGSRVARPKIKDKDNFELKGQFLKELRTNTFSGSDHEDANEHIEKVLEIIDLFHIPNITIDQILDSRGAIPSKTVTDAKVSIQEMAEYSQKWHKGTSRSRSTKTSDGLAAIQAQLNNLGREIKKVNEKVYAAQVACEQCKGPHYTKDFPLKEEGKTLKEAYYTQFGGPFQGGGYRAAAPRFYQMNNENPSYQERRQSMEDILSKFMSESAKRHEENSNLIKEIRALMDASIRNQGASIKTLEIQIGQMSKVLKERGFGSLPSSTEANPRDQVKLISTRASVSVMPLSTYLNLGLGELAHTKLTVDLADRTVKYPKGIAKSVLVAFELRRNQGDDLMATIKEGEVIEEFRTRDDELDTGIDDYPSYFDYDKKIHIACAHNLKFSCIIGFKFTHSNFFSLLYVNVMPKKFHNSTMRDKMVYKGYNVIGALMNVPIFVGTFSVKTNLQF
ncbi:hypothetical protein Tco_0897040 [Tanacetum coccineum]